MAVTGERAMQETEHGVRASTNQMLDMIERLGAIERSKQDTAIGSDEMIALAIEAERLSRVVFRWAGMQLEMAHASRTAVELGELASVRISDVEPRPLDRILANWREAQLRFEVAAPGSTEAARAAEDVERLRDEFRVVQDQRYDSQRPEPDLAGNGFRI
jgi:hypothetical protein